MTSKLMTMRTVSMISVALLSSVPAQVHAQRPASAGVDSLLQRLVGTWEMAGTVRGKPQTYRLEAARTIRDKYVELHMTDVGQPAMYAARVFLGVDTATRHLIAHWIDNFGAGFSVPHAVGEMRGDTLQFTFAYDSGPFRDTFSYDRARNEWHFLLESGVAGGGWKLFGDYRVKRK